MLSVIFILSPYGGLVIIVCFSFVYTLFSVCRKSFCPNCIYASTQAFFALSFEISIIVGSISYPMIACSLSSITFCSASCNSTSQSFLSNRSNHKKAYHIYLLRISHGAIFFAKRAASITIVPAPQNGSTKGVPNFQPDESTSAAARFSLSGAAPACWRYQRW